MRNVFYRATDGKNSDSSKQTDGVFLRHQNWMGKATKITNDLDANDSTFIIRPNPQGVGVQFESVNFPKYFLRHQNYRVKLNAGENRELFKKDSTFIPYVVDCKE